MFSRKWRYSIALAGILLCLKPAVASDLALTLDAAVKKALASDDPYLLEPEERAKATSEHAVADGQLPDPKLQVAFANWPTDSFSYTQEPMTQIKVGVNQAFPRGDTRRLAREKREVEAGSLRLQQDMRRLEIVRDTRLAWLDLYVGQTSVKHINNSRQAIAELIEVTESSFAVGKNKSQDIFRAQMEMALLDDKLLDYAQKIEIANAHLTRRIGEYSAIKAAGQPVLKHPEIVTVIKELLLKHPRIAMKQQSITVAEKDIALASEQYKPGWAMSLDYGMRGNDRADFASVGVSMDIPLFTSNRQDRRLTAARQVRQAEQLSHSAALMDLERMLMTSYAVWTGTEDRIKLYRQVVRERAKDTSEASLASYQSGVTDFPELVRARLAELEIELKLLQLQHERLRAQTELLYLEGEYDA